MFIVSTDDTPGPVYATRINAMGTIVWGPVLLSTTSTNRSPRLCSDGGGGAFVAWVRRVSGGEQVYVQRISAAGVIQWATPVPASNPSLNLNPYSLVVASGVQSMFLGYWSSSNYYVARINAAGTLASPGLAGLPVWTSGGTDASLVPTGTDSVIVAWTSFESTILVQKIASSGGAISSVWGSGTPVRLSHTAYFARNAAGAEDGSGGVLVTWAQSMYMPSVKTEVRVQKVNAAGVAQWTANGVTLVDSSVVGGTSLWKRSGCPDGRP